MGGKGSKSPSESEKTPERSLDSDSIQGAAQSLSKPEADSSIAKTTQIER